MLGRLGLKLLSFSAVFFPLDHTVSGDHEAADVSMLVLWVLWQAPIM